MLTSSLLQTLMRTRIITKYPNHVIVKSPVNGNSIVYSPDETKYVISCFPVSWKRFDCVQESIFSLCPLGSFLEEPMMLLVTDSGPN